MMCRPTLRRATLRRTRETLPPMGSRPRRSGMAMLTGIVLLTLTVPEVNAEPIT
jgi:hypothetical protein